MLHQLVGAEPSASRPGQEKIVYYPGACGVSLHRLSVFFWYFDCICYICLSDTI
ncbi:hypothetical protein Syun_013938 [Stephania yunnanensis]|uniref:Uncharacterized protein n=1 Tax=Stephania yunnanensis TaxID=152371 RepID=A0AAP0JIA8_9MAGN